MPGTDWTFASTSLPRSSTLLASGPHDHVVRARDVLGQGDARDLRDAGRDVGRLAHLGLDEDVRLDHHDRPPARRL